MLAQSFILLKPVFHCLNEILDLCHSFCSLVSQNLGPLDERGAAQLSILVKVRLPGSMQPCRKDRGL
ncbi:tubulin gamma complex associated protein 4 [Homo sapiens]|nr:tubulin gamma complex associated protein 4 [Homo sapiens]KAI4057464.1 tubulin gamma complex associated protein 4 [Homo sapiens]